MLEQEYQNIVDIEESLLSDCLNNLSQQIEKYNQRSYNEEIRSRELSSQVVATVRAEDRALLMSEEAVSHGLKKSQNKTLNNLNKLIDKPYFARVVLQEKTEKGAIREIEYRLGQYANPDCRIVDWRHAPISKIFYEYQEGEEYCEDIRGIERNGEIKLRRTLEIKKGKLYAITSKAGRLKKEGEKWQVTDAGNLRNDQGEGYSSLPSILSLITNEQFSLITSETDSPLVLQGIAGSGKTTVALHRLSWLEHNDTEGKLIGIITRSEFLKSYILNSSKKLGVTGEILTFEEWIKKVVTQISALKEIKIINNQTPTSLKRIFCSNALIPTEVSKENPVLDNSEDVYAIIHSALAHPEEILSRDSTKLISRDLIKSAQEYIKKCASEKTLCFSLLTLFLNRINLRQIISVYDHLLIDEAQDYWPLEIRALTHAVKKENNLIIVGDSNQSILSSSTAVPWHQSLKNIIGSKENLTQLDISFRNTMPIMTLASGINSMPAPKSGRAGRVPLWIRRNKEAEAVVSAVSWLNKACSLYPQALQAVLCANEEEAKKVFRFLQPSFGPAINLGAPGYWIDSGIIVLSIRQAKGLEFQNVIIWDASDKNFPNTEVARNFLYIAATRAEENLCILTWSKPTSLIPEKLCRVSEPEEEQ